MQGALVTEHLLAVPCQAAMKQSWAEAALMNMEQSAFYVDDRITKVGEGL